MDDKRKREPEKPLSAALRTLWDETLATVPQEVMEPDRKKTLQKDWAKLAERYGIGRFRIGVEEARLHTKWFPSTREIIERMPAEDTALSIKYDPQCQLCWGFGWKPVSGKPLKDDKWGRKERCDCRQIEFKRGA